MVPQHHQQLKKCDALIVDQHLDTEFSVTACSVFFIYLIYTDK